MRLAWATDIHLNFLDLAGRREFLEPIGNQADALLVTGDIADGRTLTGVLDQMAFTLKMPIYFVLGNHDYYHSSIARTRAEVAQLVAEFPSLIYLSQAGVVEMTPTTALVGHDGWGDARLGDFERSNVRLNDFELIDELRLWRGMRVLDKPALAVNLRALADEAAAHLRDVLPRAAARFSRVLVATHVPPFREAAWYKGSPSADDWLPYFSCKAVGDVLLEVAQANPSCRITVLCGHTHGGGEVQMLENLRVLTGPAMYREPVVQQVLEA